MADLDRCAMSGDDPGDVAEEPLTGPMTGPAPEDVVPELSHRVERFIGCVAAEGHWPGVDERTQDQPTRAEKEWMAKLGAGVPRTVTSEVLAQRDGGGSP